MRGIASWLVSSRGPLWDRYPGQCDFTQKRSHKRLRDGTRPRSLLVFKVANVFFFPCLSNLPACRGFPDSFSFLFPCRPSFPRFFPVTSFIRLCILSFLLSYLLMSLRLPASLPLFSYSLPTARRLLSSLLIFLID